MQETALGFEQMDQALVPRKELEWELCLVEETLVVVKDCKHCQCDSNNPELN